MIICPHCDWINSDQDSYCARCDQLLKTQTHKAPEPSPVPVSNPVNNIERNVIVGCCVLSLLLFFFPLVTIHVPIAGAQEVSGYDVFSKLTQFKENLKSRESTSLPTSQTTTGRVQVPDLPMSLMLAWLTPLALITAFVSAAAALILAFKALYASRIFASLVLSAPDFLFCTSPS